MKKTIIVIAVITLAVVAVFVSQNVASGLEPRRPFPTFPPITPVAVTPTPTPDSLLIHTYEDFVDLAPGNASTIWSYPERRHVSLTLGADFPMPLSTFEVWGITRWGEFLACSGQIENPNTTGSTGANGNGGSSFTCDFNAQEWYIYSIPTNPPKPGSGISQPEYIITETYPRSGATICGISFSGTDSAGTSKK